MEEPRIPKAKEGEAELQHDQEHAHRVFRHSRDCAPWICSPRPDHEHRVLLQCSSPSEGGHSVKTTWIVARRQLAAPWWQCTLLPSAGIDVSLYKGTILKGMLPKLKWSKYILVYRSSLGTFWYTLVFFPSSYSNRTCYTGQCVHRFSLPLQQHSLM